MEEELRVSVVVVVVVVVYVVNQINNTLNTDCKADFIFVIDSSSSVKEEFENAKKFVVELSKNLQIDNGNHRCALAEFSGRFRRVLRYNFNNFTTTKQFISKVKGGLFKGFV